jgi:phosphate transport system substrate-binding protein
LRNILFSAIMMIATLLLVCCNQTGVSKTPEPSADSEIKPLLSIWGPTGFESFIERLMPIIEASDLPYDLRVFDGPSTDAGIQGVVGRTFDLMILMRETGPNEPLVFQEYARVPIAIFAHPELGIGSLTRQQAASIFSGEVTNWSQLGGPDFAIVVFRQEDDDTMTIAMRASILDGKPFVESAQIVANEFALFNVVESIKGAIGYASLSGEKYLEFTSGVQYTDPVMLDDVAPADPAYSFVSAIGVAYRPDREDYVRPFLDWATRFVGSPALNMLLEQFGVRLVGNDP